MNRVDDASRKDSSAYRAARRAAARANHPDVGGDAQSLFDALAAVDKTFGAHESHASGEAPRVFVTVSPARRIVKAGSRLLRIQKLQKSRKHYFEI